jgi:hypothetical protein
VHPLQLCIKHSRRCCCCCRCRCCCCWCRSDDLEGLKLWAPKLADLELRACYSLECVRLMEDPPGIPLTPIRVRPMAATGVCSPASYAVVVWLQHQLSCGSCCKSYKLGIGWVACWGCAGIPRLSCSC